MTKGRTYLGLGLALGLFGAAAAPAWAQIRITEWMYSGVNGEYVELTNMGGAPVNMTGWSYSDDATPAGTVDLSGFGIVAPGQSVIFTESTVADFRANWGLAPSVSIIGLVTTNLSRNDMINIYNGISLMDTLDFGDQSTPGAGIRTQNRGGGPNSDAVLGTNTVTSWSFVDAGGDPHGVGFLTSLGGDIGNPGATSPNLPALACSLWVVRCF